MNYNSVPLSKQPLDVSPTETVGEQSTVTALTVTERLAVVGERLPAEHQEAFKQIESLFGSAQGNVKEKVVGLANGKMDAAWEAVTEDNKRIGQYIDYSINNKKSSIRLNGGTVSRDVKMSSEYNNLPFAKALPPTLVFKAQDMIQKAGEARADEMADSYVPEARKLADGTQKEQSPRHDITESDTTSIQGIAVAEFEAGLESILGKLESSLDKAEASRRGNAVLRLMSSSARSDNYWAQRDVVSALDGIKRKLEQTSKVTIANQEYNVGRQVEAYLKEAHLVPPTYSERRQVVDAALSSLNAQYSSSVVEKNIRNYLFNTYIPSLKVTEPPQTERPNSTSSHFGHVGNDPLGEFLRGYTANEQGTPSGRRHNNNDAGSRQNRQSVSQQERTRSNFSEIDAEINRLRADGVEDSKIKRQLSKRYHPDVSKDPMAKEKMQHITNRFI